jgi:hypothetical protein
LGNFRGIVKKEIFPLKSRIFAELGGCIMMISIPKIDPADFFNILKKSARSITTILFTPDDSAHIGAICGPTIQYKDGSGPQKHHNKNAAGYNNPQHFL